MTDALGFHGNFCMCQLAPNWQRLFTAFKKECRSLARDATQCQMEKFKGGTDNRNYHYIRSTDVLLIPLMLLPICLYIYLLLPTPRLNKLCQTVDICNLCTPKIYTENLRLINPPHIPTIITRSNA